MDFKEIEFSFKKLEEELSEHETYDGIDNFVKYFIKVHMVYQGGSLLAGNNLEKLHEIKVKNYYAKQHAKRLLEEQKQEAQKAAVTETSTLTEPAVQTS